MLVRIDQSKEASKVGNAWSRSCQCFLSCSWPRSATTRVWCLMVRQYLASASETLEAVLTMCWCWGEMDNNLTAAALNQLSGDCGVGGWCDNVVTEMSQWAVSELLRIGWGEGCQLLIGQHNDTDLWLVTVALTGSRETRTIRVAPFERPETTHGSCGVETVTGELHNGWIDVTWWTGNVMLASCWHF